MTTFFFLTFTTFSLLVRIAMPPLAAQHGPERLSKKLTGEGSFLLSGHVRLRPLVVLESRLVGLGSSSGDERKVRIARAKLGDKVKQQQFVCELYSADKQTMQSMALEDLPKIGGWYAIQMYRALLSPGARVRYYRARNTPDQDSTSVSEPRIWSLAQLPKIVPNPPLNLPDPSLDNQELLRQVQLWKDWIHANEMSLRKLEPTGEGTDFSGRSCEGNRRIPLRNGEGPR